MAVLAVQIGQCGNQLGAALFSRIAEEISIAQSADDDSRAETLADTFFREAESSPAKAPQAFARTDWQSTGSFASAGGYKLELARIDRGAWNLAPSESAYSDCNGTSSPAVARCILIDSEPGVLNACMASVYSAAPLGARDKKGFRLHGCPTFSSRNLHHSAYPSLFHWRYDRRNAICGARAAGCGNNWAVGYLREGPDKEEAIVGALQRELEKIDRSVSILLIHSLAGGTGSGLGAFVSELCRDLLGSTPTANLAVWPFASGELSVQSYNAALSLAHAYPCTNGVFLAENARFEELCRASGPSVGGPSFDDMNRGIAAAVASAALLPFHSAVVPNAPRASREPKKTAGSHNKRNSIRNRDAPSAGRSTPRQTASAAAVSPEPQARDSDECGNTDYPPLGVSPLPFVLQDLCMLPAYKLLTVFHKPIPPLSSASLDSNGAGGSPPYTQHDSPLGCDTYAGLYKQTLRLFSRRVLPLTSCIASQQCTDPGGGSRATTLSRQEIAVAASLEKGEEFYPSYPISSSAPAQTSAIRCRRGEIRKTCSDPTSNSFGRNWKSVRDTVHSGYLSKDNVQTAEERRSGGIGTVGTWAIVKGKDVDRADLEEAFRPEEQLSAVVRAWEDAPLRVIREKTSGRGGTNRRSATLISNCQTPAVALRAGLEKGKAMIAFNAYTHHYEKHGLPRSDIQESLMSLETIAQAYEML
ncbi:tubulin/FtsZ family, GTPase domain-containing protein [Besnoitia besnoiti]|uniref:Tubulin delta chain n=1 Tax=Besnoitia besnoiti TaxID=94643 RepID=A0A2A9M8M4_BESBE|nr:tubulin/FtsZ family, GTPase domain-containing protein [Besnoitia besnoiti]PFH31740.1 tubulin/FtsZ family, GTPase domain-containing protein [Besnoitia besnoiti]